MKAKILMFLFGLLTAVQAHAGDVSYYFWQGKMEGRQVKMACAVKDDVMTGELKGLGDTPDVCMTNISTDMDKIFALVK